MYGRNRTRFELDERDLLMARPRGRSRWSEDRCGGPRLGPRGQTLHRDRDHGRRDELEKNEKPKNVCERGALGPPDSKRKNGQRGGDRKVPENGFENRRGHWHPRPVSRLSYAAGGGR